MTFAPTIAIEVEQGVDEELRLIWRDRVTQVPVDLTGWSGVMRLGTTPLTLLPAEVTAEGSIVVQLPAALTSLIGETTTEPRFELDLTDPNGRIKRFLKGSVRIARGLL